MKVLCLFVSFASVAATTCPLLHEPAAEIWNGVVGTAVVKDHAVAQKDIEAMNLDPNLSKCIGSLDMSMIDAVSIFGDKHCTSALNQVMPDFMPPFSLNTTLAPRYEKMMNEVKFIQEKNKNSTVGLIRDFEAYFVRGLSADMYENITDLFRSKISHCIYNAIVPMAFKFMFDLKNDCCADFKAAYVRKTLQHWTMEYTRKALLKVIDLMFTIHSQGESCMKTIVRASMGRQQLEANVKHFVSIPNSMACPAALGETFKTHVHGGQWYQYFKAIRCCIYNIESIVADVRNFPLAIELFTEQAFAINDYDCVDAASLPIIQTAIDALVDPEMKQWAKKFVNGLCLHFSNGYGTCAGAGTCSTVSSLMH